MSLSNFKVYRDKLKHIIRSAKKKKFYTKKINDAEGKPDTTWKGIKDTDLRVRMKKYNCEMVRNSNQDPKKLLKYLMNCWGESGK